MSIPMNRVVAFLGPYISAAAGLAAAWLVAKVNVLGLPGLDEHNATTLISAGLTQVVVTGVTWLGHSKWLTGHHVTIEAEAKVQAAALTAATMPTDPPAGAPVTGLPENLPPEWSFDHHAADDLEPGEGLVSDADEFASPPDGEESAVKPDDPDA